jgi:predicted ester cyclase
LGPELHGPEGFISYLRSIHAALADYTCIIEDLIVAENRAAARMTFKGLHRGRFFRRGGVRSGDPMGGAFFTTDSERIVALWVLGDIDSVKHQLNARANADFGPN